MQRCNWKNLENNPIYMEYHDTEWGVPSHDDRYLFEMLVLESFHCGLSWLLILKKREAFQLAFDHFDPVLVAQYDEDKVQSLLQNANIVRHVGKIRAAIANAQAFLRVQQAWGSFDAYIWSFTAGAVQYLDGDTLPTRTALSDLVAKDLKRRGFKFMGSVTTLSYLQAIGVCNHHVPNCDWFTGENAQESIVD